MSLLIKFILILWDYFQIWFIFESYSSYFNGSNNEKDKLEDLSARIIETISKIKYVKKFCNDFFDYLLLGIFNSNSITKRDVMYFLYNKILEYFILLSFLVKRTFNEDTIF